MPVSNARLETGCSALKRIKTRLRNRLGVDKLQTRLRLLSMAPRLECLKARHWLQWQLTAQKRRKMLKRNEGESLSSASASSVSSQIQSDASEQMDTPVNDLQAVSSDSEVEIANAALNLTAAVPCHDDTDFDYHSESDVDDNIFFWNLVICLWTCLIEIEINACREFWLKTENRYFWTDFNVWLINVTPICPRMLKNTSRSVSNFNFFCSMPPEPHSGTVSHYYILVIGKCIDYMSLSRHSVWFSFSCKQFSSAEFGICNI